MDSTGIDGTDWDDHLEVAALRPGHRIDGSLLLGAVEVRETKNGDPYLAGTLRDETGRIELRQWDEHQHPPAGTVVRLTGQVDEYKGALQVVVDRMAIDQEADPADYIESAHRPADELLDEVRRLVDLHCEQPLVDLLDYVLGYWPLHNEPQHRTAKSTRGDRLRESPAAKRNHHARHGGLIEHIHSMCWTACRMVEHYQERYGQSAPRLDLLLAGCILHDIGKLDEMSGPIGTEYTREGELAGHIAIGLRHLDKAAEAADVSQGSELYQHLRHLILSHHGKREWGSPVEPKTPEAVLLHQIDMLDSRLDPVCSALSKAGEGAERVETSAGQELLVMGGGGDRE